MSHASQHTEKHLAWTGWVKHRYVDTSFQWTTAQETMKPENKHCIVGVVVHAAK